MKSFILIMLWLNGIDRAPLVLGPFETEKLCVDAAGQLYSRWKDRYVGGDFLCLPSAYEDK